MRSGISDQALRCARSCVGGLLLLSGATAVAGAIVPPKLVESSAPDYPRRALSEGIEGTVDLEFTVGADGKVRDISVVKSEPRQIFEVAAVKAVSKWIFTPAMRDGQAIDSHQRQHIEFKQ